MANVMLPKQINPIQLAEQQKTLRGELALSDMERLIEIIVGKPGMVFFEFHFGWDILGYPYMRGTIKTGFDVICQRCNSPMFLQLNIALEVSPVHTDEEAERLPKNYDPLFLTDDTMSLLTMVEEEILLGIPIVPKHSKKECKIKSSELFEWKDEKEKSNPFEVLKKLLRE